LCEEGPANDKKIQPQVEATSAKPQASSFKQRLTAGKG